MIFHSYVCWPLGYICRTYVIVGQSVTKNGTEIASENNELGAEHLRSITMQSGAGEMELERGNSVSSNPMASDLSARQMRP